MYALRELANLIYHIRDKTYKNESDYRSKYFRFLLVTYYYHKTENQIVNVLLGEYLLMIYEIMHGKIKVFPSEITEGNMSCEILRWI